jgi:hypothetical protein
MEIKSGTTFFTVFFSAFAGGDSLERAKQTWPAGFLAKPFLGYQLRDVMAAAFNGC